MVLAGAMAVSVAAVNLTRPLFARWLQREQKIEQRRDRLGRMRDLAASESTLRTAAAGATRDPGPRALGGRTPALAAAELQALLQRYADASRVTVTRLDVTSAAEGVDAGSVVPMIPATLSAIGDIHGVAELLEAVQHGARVLEVTDLSIVQNAVFKGGLLQLTLSVRGPWIARD